MAKTKLKVVEEEEPLFTIEKKELTFTCPVRGQVTEIVEVKVYTRTGGKSPVQVCR